MPSRKGPAYPITPQWQGWVRERIQAMIAAGEVKSQAKLAARAGLGRSTLTEVLDDDAVQTTVMPEIHKALGWPPPLMTPPVHVLQLVEAFTKLSEIEQGRWLERMRSEVEKRRALR